MNKPAAPVGEKHLAFQWDFIAGSTVDTPISLLLGFDLLFSGLPVKELKLSQRKIGR